MERGKVPHLFGLPDEQLSGMMKDLHVYLTGLELDLLTVEGIVLPARLEKLNSTVMAIDPRLSYMLKPHGKYRIFGKILCSENVKLRFVGPASPAQVLIARTRISTNGSAFDLDTVYSTTDIAINKASLIKLEGIILNGPNGGFFRIQWAQDHSSSTPSFIYPGSWLQCSRLVGM